jgi:hypothetical protein
MIQPEEFTWNLPRGCRDVRFHYYDSWDSEIRLMREKMNAIRKTMRTEERARLIGKRSARTARL